MESIPSPRFVPGAPPPTPLSKSQKKKLLAKRKPANPAVVQRDASPEEQNDSVENHHTQEVAAPESVTQSEPTAAPEGEVLHKPSPIVDLVNKRLKSTTKKIVSCLKNFSFTSCARISSRAL